MDAQTPLLRLHAEALVAVLAANIVALRRVPLTTDAEPARVNGYVDWLGGLFPPYGDSGVLGSVQPDLLAESLDLVIAGPVGRHDVEMSSATGS